MEITSSGKAIDEMDDSAPSQWVYAGCGLAGIKPRLSPDPLTMFVRGNRGFNLPRTRRG
jgi:hypothetical protein